MKRSMLITMMAVLTLCISSAIPADEPPIPAGVTDSLPKDNLNWFDKYEAAIAKAKVEEKQVSLPDRRVINYGEAPNEKPALLLIHGQQSIWEDYALVLPALSENWHIYAVDVYGRQRMSPLMAVTISPARFSKIRRSSPQKAKTGRILSPIWTHLSPCMNMMNRISPNAGNHGISGTVTGAGCI